MKRHGPNVLPSVELGMVLDVIVVEPLRCSRCDDDQDVAQDWRGTPLCPFCRERVRETEDAEADE